jgi:hypothetical protein
MNQQDALYLKIVHLVCSYYTDISRCTNVGITVHGQQNFKLVDAQQGNLVYRYKNIKEKLYETNAAIWYNKTRRHKQLTPNYISLNLLAPQFYI